MVDGLVGHVGRYGPIAVVVGLLRVVAERLWIVCGSFVDRCGSFVDRCESLWVAVARSVF